MVTETATAGEQPVSTKTVPIPLPLQQANALPTASTSVTPSAGVPTAPPNPTNPAACSAPVSTAPITNNNSNTAKLPSSLNPNNCIPNTGATPVVTISPNLSVNAPNKPLTPNLDAAGRNISINNNSAATTTNINLKNRQQNSTTVSLNPSPPSRPPTSLLATTTAIASAPSTLPNTVLASSSNATAGTNSKQSPAPKPAPLSSSTTPTAIATTAPSVVPQTSATTTHPVSSTIISQGSNPAIPIHPQVVKTQHTPSKATATVNPPMTKTSSKPGLVTPIANNENPKPVTIPISSAPPPTETAKTVTTTGAVPTLVTTTTTIVKPSSNVNPNNATPTPVSKPSQPTENSIAHTQAIAAARVVTAVANVNANTANNIDAKIITTANATKPKTASSFFPTPRPPEPHFTVPLDDDPVRSFLEMKARDDPKSTQPSPTDMQEWCELAWHRIPLTVQQAFDSFDMVRLPRSDITHCLFTLNLKSHTILRVDIQRRILAIKLVQRQISLLAVVEVKNDIDKNNPSLATEQHTLIRSLPPTSVWRNPSNRRETIPDDIPWTSGDIPIFDENGDVIPGQPVLPPPGVLAANEDRSRNKVGRSKSRPHARRKRETTLFSTGINNINNNNNNLNNNQNNNNTNNPGTRSGSGAGVISSNIANGGGGSGGKQNNNLTFTGNNRTTQGGPMKEDENLILVPPPSTQTSGPVNAATSTAITTGANVNQDVFDSSEYCRLLHVLCEERMRRALDAISRPVAGYDPWNHDIAPLFNDPKYSPSPIRKVCNGVRASDIVGLHPQLCRRPQNGAILAIKFSEFKEVYVAAARGYMRIQKKDTVMFSDFCPGLNYVSYAFCLFDEVSHLEPIILRNGPSNSNRNANNLIGFASGTDGSGNGSPGEGRASGPPMKKRRVPGTGPDANLNGITTGNVNGTTGDAFILAGRTIHRSPGGMGNGVSVGPNNENDNDMMPDDMGSGLGVSNESRRLERLHSTLAESDRTVFETEEARVRMVTAILVAIREARAFAAEANTGEDRTICETVLRQLHSKLSDQVNVQPYR